MANKSNKNTINIESYKRLLEENELLKHVLKTLKKEYKFPIDSLLEIGAGLGNYLTKFLVESERAKKISKFYAMEPIEEFFNEAKKSVVRLSRTDATTQEFYGGNPFDVITFAMVFNHIKPDQKAKFIKNLSSNFKDGGKLVLMDVLIDDYKDEEDKKEKISNLFSANIEYYKKTKQEYPMNYFTNVSKNVHDDYWIGKYKSSLPELVKLLEQSDFENINVDLIKGKGKGNWEEMGHYIITADKSDF